MALHSAAQHVNDVKQTFSISQQVLRWCLSISCVTFLSASLKIYQDNGILTSTQVSIFNAITTVLGLLLGLGFFVGLAYWGLDRTSTDLLIGCIQRSRKGFQVENLE